MAQLLPPIDDPRPVDLKCAPKALGLIFRTLVDELETAALEAGHRLRYRHDNSRSNRYFWIYSEDTTPGGHFLTVNIAPVQYARDAVTVHLKCFSRRKRNQGSELVPEAMLEMLQTSRNTAPYLRLKTIDELRTALPLLIDHMSRVLRQIDEGWSIPRAGYSNIEFSLYALLKQRDSPLWEYPCTPSFLGRRHVDMGRSDERLGIEFQGDYWHSKAARQAADIQKKDDLLSQGWKLIWVWENALREEGGFERVLRALRLVRGGGQFVEVGERPA